jgi:hypothetical protein
MSEYESVNKRKDSKYDNIDYYDNSEEMLEIIKNSER